MRSASQLAREIVAAFRSANAVASPDHPYLMRGPDVLASDESGIVALFVEHVSEVSDGRLLTARLILSNLALPSHTRFVVVPRGGQVASWDWDLVLDTDDPREITQVTRRVERSRAETPREVRGAALERAHHALTGERWNQRSEGVEIDYTRARRSSAVRVEGGHLFADVGNLSGSAASARLTQLFALSVPSEFAIDNGAIYPRAGVLPIHTLRASPALTTSRVFDPLKILRCAAFAGWAIEGPPAETSIWDDLDLESWGMGDE
jgi:hypothetical protein